MVTLAGASAHLCRAQAPGAFTQAGASTANGADCVTTVNWDATHIIDPGLAIMFHGLTFTATSWLGCFAILGKEPTKPDADYSETRKHLGVCE
jgi:hypothetical protein